jgi:outer membrane receptor protein involved in Fe transport
LPEPHDNDLRHATLRPARDSGPIGLVLSSGLTTHEVGDTIDATIGADQFGLANPATLESSRYFRVWDSEARVFSHGGRIDWLVGISHIEARQTLTSTLYDITDTNSLVIDEDSRRVFDSAIFGDVTFPIFDRVRLNLGGRQFRAVNRESRVVDGQLRTERRVYRGFTPTVAIAWQPRDTRLLYLRYGSAYRPGGRDIDTNGDLRLLRSDELATIEAGWRETTPGGARLDLGTYFSIWQHIQSDQLGADGLIETSNVGDGQIFGFEASAQVPLGHRWHADLGASLTKAALTSTDPGYDSDDRRLPVVPEYTLRGSLTRQFEVAGAPALVELRLRYLGPARLSFDPAIDRPMGEVLETGLRAEMTLGGIAFELAADNLLGGSADTFAFGNPLRFALGRQFTPQAPRRVSLSARTTF